VVRGTKLPTSAVNPWTIGEDGNDPAARDWASSARQLAVDARLLLDNSSLRNAYATAGMAVEHALKAKIMQHERMNTWPSRQRRPDVHTHNMSRLIELGGLRVAIQLEVARGSDLGLSWMLIKDFNINDRYPSGRPFPLTLASDAVWACEEGGLIGWLTQTIL